MQELSMIREGYTAQIRINGKWQFVDKTYFDRHITTRTKLLQAMVNVMAKLNIDITKGRFEYESDPIKPENIRYVKVVTTWTVVEA